MTLITTVSRKLIKKKKKRNKQQISFSEHREKVRHAMSDFYLQNYRRVLYLYNIGTRRKLDKNNFE